MAEALLSVSEAAKRLGGISKWTVHAWLSQGRLRRTKVGGRTMIRESELAKVIEEGGKSPSPRKRNEAKPRPLLNYLSGNHGEAPSQLPPSQNPSQLQGRGSLPVVWHSQEHCPHMDQERASNLRSKAPHANFRSRTRNFPSGPSGKPEAALPTR